MKEAACALPGRGPRSWMQRAGALVAVCSWLYLLAVLGLWLFLSVADVWWPATFLMFSPRWMLAVPAAVLAGAALLVRRRSLAVPLAAFLLAAGPVAGFVIPWQSLGSDPVGGTPLRVLTCNMHYRDSDATALDRFLEEARPDVATFQEWPGWQRSHVLAGEGWHIKTMTALVLASRHPIRQAVEIGTDSMEEEGSVGRFELETPAGIVTLFSLHLASPRSGLYGVVHDRGDGADDLEEGSILRRRQQENLFAECQGVTGPVVLAGDFNTPAESDIFRRTWGGGYTDAFSAAGWGWGYTFLGGRTAVRIDHVLVGPGWRCRRCRVGPNVGSPHRPVIADLVWIR